VKNFIKTSLIISIFALSVFAQLSETVKVRLDKNKDAAKQEIINVQLQTGTEISNAVFIEFPAGLKPVLHSARADNKDLWLINSKKQISKENVVGWYQKDNGLLFHYSDALLQNNSTLQFDIVTDSSRLERYTDIEIKVYPVESSGQDRVVQKTALAEKKLIVKKVD
jgi:hypothetical protein